MIWPQGATHARFIHKQKGAMVWNMHPESDVMYSKDSEGSYIPKSIVTKHKWWLLTGDYQIKFYKRSVIYNEIVKENIKEKQ